MSIYSELLTLAASAIRRSPDELSMEAPLEEQGADSVDMVEILLAVEDRYGVYVPDSAVAEMRTLAELAAWLDAHLDQ